ncbi:hypothetical protein PRIPAC_92803, partial [Pristionchus pacificus]|uniref:Uncharacterized protein n=1 Tax=Pristionchus pacificus TaxID=54126 RepID=A0A2A6CEF1_PRIPA
YDGDDKGQEDDAKRRKANRYFEDTSVCFGLTLLENTFSFVYASAICKDDSEKCSHKKGQSPRKGPCKKDNACALEQAKPKPTHLPGGWIEELDEITKARGLKMTRDEFFTNYILPFYQDINSIQEKIDMRKKKLSEPNKYDQQPTINSEVMKWLDEYNYIPGWFPPENNPARPAPCRPPTGPNRPHAFLWLVQIEI